MGGLIGISATPEPRNAIMLPWLGGFQVCVCAAQAALCPGLLHCSQPRNEQYFCHHREGARSRGAGRVTLQGPQDHRMMSPIGTFETCLPILRMSVHRGRPEVAVVRPNRRE